MKNIFLFILLLFLGLENTRALDLPVVSNTTVENPNSCIQVLVNNKRMTNGAFVGKEYKGTITVENSLDKKISFNLILKTNINKPNQPPIFLRFVKLNQFEIQKVLNYAKTGDEIYIEQYLENTMMKSFCSPSLLVVA
jgi:hypothetical protein